MIDTLARDLGMFIDTLSAEQNDMFFSIIFRVVNEAKATGYHVGHLCSRDCENIEFAE